MQILLADDDFISRKILMQYLGSYGECDIAIDGQEVVNAVEAALKKNKSYDLICLDIAMPNMDGHEALQKIRRLEQKHGIQLGKGAKVIMATGMSGHEDIINAFHEQCDAYMIKPIKKADLNSKLKELNLT